MSGVRRFGARVVEWVRRGSQDRDLDEELGLHYDLMVEDLQARGLDPAEARRQAELRLGRARARDQVRDVRGFAPIDALLADVRHALRTLRRAPGFAAATILTLSLGVGVNVAIFTMVDTVMLRPLPYPGADRLLALWEIDTTSAGAGRRLSASPANMSDYRRAPSLAGLAGYASRLGSLSGDGSPAPARLETITHDYFEVLGTPPALGRAFTRDEARSPDSRLAVLSHRLWQDRFGGDLQVLGRLITIDGVPHQVVGVMPPSFRGLFEFASGDPVAAWVPLSLPADIAGNRREHLVRLVGRLAPGATLAAARDELATIGDGLARSYPASNADVRVQLQPLQDDVVRGVRVSLLILLVTVVLILSMASVTITSLLLARGVERRREVAVRLALGAGRVRVAVAALVEGLVLAACATVTGGLLASWLIALLVHEAPPGIPRLDDAAFDLRAAGWTALVGLAAGVGFGAVAWWQVGHAHPSQALAGHGRVSSDVTVLRWRTTLMVAQIAMSTMLLVGAGLTVKSLWRLNNVALGFDPERVVAMRIALPAARYGTGEARLAFFEQLEARLRSRGGVTGVAFATQLPMRGEWTSGFVIEGRPLAGESHDAGFQAVSAGYFTTLGVPVERGRLFGRGDTEGARPVAVVSRQFERRYFPGGEALGARMRRHPDAPWITIVGVVGDVRRDGHAGGLAPQVYLPASQTSLYPTRLAEVAVRVEGPPEAVVPSLRAAVWAIDAEQTVANVRTLDELLVERSADRRFRAVVFSLFAALALVLAAVGVYGVIAYLVRQRTHEIGVRLALGATRAAVYRALIAPTTALVGGGVVLGLLAARWLGRFLASALFEVGVGDAASYALAAVVVWTVGIAASVSAARRAAALDVTAALRSE